ncbi:hypothetical protein A3A59_03335 [Candidatus Gottesmanbacteria bacterium RIFCSPLOWO2_01_FULL_42_10]|nr:MAG: hypothetical protein A3A59_03335 [Candidatus Gottesmanbacteria bacterium RIFCSPLOWO2_01_FULL_42_10]
MKKTKGISYVSLTFLIILLILVGLVLRNEFFLSLKDRIIIADPHIDSPYSVLDQNPNATMFQKTLHPYPAYGTDTKRVINKIHIISLLFIPKDIERKIKNEWFVNMELIDKEIKNFYEEQFGHQMNITYEIVSYLIKGDENIVNYTPWTMATEAKNKTQSLSKKDRYTIWMIYLIRDEDLTKNLAGGSLGGLASIQAATQYEFWLDDDAISKNHYGLVGSAHEFGHVLGIPHPWELPGNINNDPNYGNVPGDLMGYQGGAMNTLNTLFIRDDVKRTMGL